MRTAPRADASLGPSRRQLQRGLGPRALGRIRRALVERHHQVRAESLLDFDRALRRKHELGAVEVRAKADSVGADRVELGEAHRLEAAGIGQHRAVETHEARHPAEFLDKLGAGAQREMVRVGEHQPIAQLPQLLGRHRLDRRARANRHEGRRRDLAVRGDEAARARVAVAREDLEAERRRRGLLGSALSAHRINIASP